MAKATEQDQQQDQGAGPVEHPPVEDQPKDGELKVADQAAETPNLDAEANDPPVRTNRPDVPILQSLATGAGQHRPPAEDEIGPDGRPV